MLRKTLKPSQVLEETPWAGVFVDTGQAVAAAALTQCLVSMGDTFDVWFSAKDLKEAAAASVNLNSIQPFVERDYRDGWKYRVCGEFLSCVSSQKQAVA